MCFLRIFVSRIQAWPEGYIGGCCALVLVDCSNHVNSPHTCQIAKVLQSEAKGTLSMLFREC